jgi:hypothetical protein
MQAARIFVEFGGQFAPWRAMHYLMLSNKEISGMDAVPQGIEILEARKSGLNPDRSVDLTITNCNGVVDHLSTAAIMAHLLKQNVWPVERVEKFADVTIPDN